MRMWGRWKLNTTPPMSLDITFACYPWVVYDITLATCQTPIARQHWLDHMATKRREAISEQDLTDLAVAFRELVNEGVLPR